MFRNQNDQITRPNMSQKWQPDEDALAEFLDNTDNSTKSRHFDPHYANPVAMIAREIHECNQILQNWLSGASPRSDQIFELLSDQMASGFTSILSDGRMIKRDALLARLRDHYGVKGRDYRLTIANLRVIVQTAILAVVCYDEHEYFSPHAADGQKTLDLAASDAQSPPARPARSHHVTSVLALNSGKRNSIEWLHRHETGHTV